MEKHSVDIEFLEQMIRIDSSDISNISQMIDVLVKTFSYVTTYKIINNTALLIGVNCELHNINKGIVFAGHIDTVSCTNCVDFSYKDEIVFGRGSSDMKSFFACLNYVLKSSASNLKFPIIISITFDEETSNKGILSIVQFFRKNMISPDFCIVGEPTSNMSCIDNKGCYDFVVRLHSSVEHIVNSKKNNVIKSGICLLDYIRDYNVEKGANLYISYVNSGGSFNQTGECFEVGIEIRCYDDVIVSNVFHDIQNYIANNVYCKGDIEFKDSYLIPFKNNSKKMLEKMTLLKIPFKGSFEASSEAGFFQKEQIDTIIFGPGDINQAHTREECIAVSKMDWFSKKLLSILENLY